MRWDGWWRTVLLGALLLALGSHSPAQAAGGRTQVPPRPPPPSTLPTGTLPARSVPVRSLPARGVRPLPAPGAPCAVPSGRPAAVRIDPRFSSLVDCNPVRTQHTVVVTVLDAQGNALPGQRVEWILARYPESVGDIVAVDDQYRDGAIAPLRSSGPTNSGNAIDNHRAVSVTNYRTEVLDRGNHFPYRDRDGRRLPDLQIGPGQSWLTITATREGVTDLVIVVPGIRDGEKHKIFIKKIWADYDVLFPTDAINVLPNDEHRMPVRVSRMDGTGIPGVTVEAEILDGPLALFEETGERLAELTTDANGDVSFNLRNTEGMPGTNRIRFTALGTFYGDTCPRSAIVAKSWQSVALEVACIYPLLEAAFVGKPFQKMVSVRNTGDAPAEGVVLDDVPQDGLQFAEQNPFPVEVGTLAPGETHTETVMMVARFPAIYENHVIATSTVGHARVENVCQIEVVEGILDITKQCQPSRVNVDDPVEFIVVVTNKGRAPLENVRIVDEFPRGIEPTSQPTVDLGTLLPGQSKEIAFTGVARQTGHQVNRARASADGVPEREALCAIDVVSCDLEMKLEGPEQVYFDETATFVLHVRNVGDGPGEACSIRVTTGACLGSAVRDFVVGALAPGQDWSQQFLLTGTQIGPCRIEANASCGARCKSQELRTLEVTGLPAIQVEMIDQSIDGREEGVFRVGETFLYRLSVLNDNGTEPTPDLRVAWRLPPELEFVSGRSNRETAVEGQGAVARSQDFQLDLREQITFEIQVRVLSVPRSGFVIATATVSRSSDGMELSHETENSSIRR